MVYGEHTTRRTRVCSLDAARKRYPTNEPPSRHDHRLPGAPVGRRARRSATGPPQPWAPAPGVDV